jgi:hypothetical protein
MESVMRLLTVLTWMALSLLLAGCTSQKPSDEEGALDVPDWLSKSGESSAEETPDSPEGADRTETASGVQTASATRPAREPRGELKLQLQPGVQFPLKKQVVTTLSQTAADGTVQEIRTELRLLMAITVEEVANGRTRLGVKYNRVEFDQILDGQQISYRSNSPPAEIPVAAQAYHDMVNDGFSFWIGKDNQINEVVGFHEFLGRCLANVPAEQQKQVLLGMEAGSDENGISDFVDNTIGLLPFGQEVTPGQEWSRHRSVTRPIPMIVQCKYTLQELTEAEAIVKITGEIIPSQTINKVNLTKSNDINVTVLGGSTTGQCVIFRETGLPKESYTERVVHMTVELGSGFAFDQTKTVQTRVEAFPAVSVAP